MNSKIDLLKERAATYLRGLADFDGINVVTYHTGSLQSSIDTSINTAGLCVLVTVAQAVPSAYPTRVPFFESVMIDISIIENLLVNTGSVGTHTNAFALAEAAARALQNWCPLGDDPANRYFVLRCDPRGFTEVTAPVSLSAGGSVQTLNSILNAVSASSAQGAVHHQRAIYHALPGDMNGEISHANPALVLLTQSWLSNI